MGADLSDHWAFSEIGVPALMVTDTAMLRSPHYHHSTDTAETVDSGRLSRVVDGLRQVLADLANGESL